MVFWLPYYKATVTVGVPNSSAFMVRKLSITKFLFLDLHTELAFVPRIMHVHGELGGNLGIRLNFLTLVGYSS